MGRAWARMGKLGALALALTTLAPVGVAEAARIGAPPKGKVLLGVGGTMKDPLDYRSMTGARHHIHLVSLGWGQGVSWGSSYESFLKQSKSGDYRLMVHVTTRGKGGAEAITPRGIAQGKGDAYLLRAGKALNESGQYVYWRPMGEMNGHWNPWCAVRANGTSKGRAYSGSAYKNAFRRMALIMRGGKVSSINSTLASHGMPKLATSATTLPRSGRVATVWNPQGEGAPNVRGNRPADYFPGYGYVTYVANDLYSQNFRANWRAQNSLYKAYPRAPFMVAEWAGWGIDDPKFVDAMFNWSRTNTRTVALLWFEGTANTSPFRLGAKPKSLARYKAWVKQTRFRCDKCGATTAP